MALAEGTLGAVDVEGNGTLTDVYTVPLKKKATVNISICNRTDAVTNLRLALIKAGTKTNVINSSYVFYDLPTSTFVSNLAPITYNNVPLGAGDTVAVYSSAEDVSVQVRGKEDDI